MNRSSMIFGIAMALALVAPLACAGEAHICSSRAFSGLTPANPPPLTLNDDTEFECPNMKRPQTIPELAKNGWKITQMRQVAEPMRKAYPGAPPFTWKILIQKP